MVKPVEVKAFENYRIWVKFADGVSGEIDLSEEAGKGVFKLWDQEDSFSRVYINEETDGIAWSKMLEISPERIYDELIRKTRKTHAA